MNSRILGYFNSETIIIHRKSEVTWVVYSSGSQSVGRGPLVSRGPLPGAPRPRLGIENFWDVSHVSQSLKRYQVLVVELELPLHV